MEDSQEALKALSGHCSAIDNDTLYVLSDSKLLSLPLQKNATVSEEAPPPQNVTEPACVKAGDALYVIGGSGTSDDYSGLQRYIFANSSWETLSPPADVLRTRTNHSVAYLEDSKDILVYAGSTDDAPSLLSSQTFLLSTQSPYIIDSFVSNAPPATEPILQRWNSSHAVMVGGETTNTGVWLFGAQDGWTRLGTNLSAPVDPSTRGILIDGSDGSKVLQLYDMSISPNTVSNIVLLDAGGETAPNGQTVNGSSSTSTSSSSSTSSSRKRKRDLTLSNWPAYNSTNAPTSTRTDCSIAQNSEGLVVMAGGNEDEPIILYNRDKNSWVDPDDFFGVKEQVPLKPSSTTSATSTASRTAEPAASTSAASGSGGLSAHDRMMKTLGITLGVLLGIAAIFIIALLLLRWRKMKAKRKAGYQQEKNAQDSNRMSFADRGASFMKEAGMSVEQLAPPNRDWAPGKDHSGHSSLAIITGKYSPSRNANHQTKASFESTAALVKKKTGMPSEKIEMMDIGDKSGGNGSKLAVPGAAVLNNNSLDPDTRAERKRSSGWSKYFATTQPTGPNGVSHIPSVYVKPGPSNTASSRESEYSQDGAASQNSRISTSVKVPPLDIDFAKIGDGHRLSKVATGSPHYFNSQDDFASRGSVDIAEGQRGLIVDPRRSQATSISSYGNRSTLDSTATSEFYNESGHTPWTPMSGNHGMISRDRDIGSSHSHERRTSSVYTATSYDPSGRRPSRGKGTGFFPGAGTTYVKPKSSRLNQSAPASPKLEMPRLPFAAKAGDVRDSTASDVTVFPDGKEADDDMAWARPPKAPFAGAKVGDVRDSTASDMTVFPGGVEDDKEHMKEGDAKPTNSDMSWVKLG